MDKDLKDEREINTNRDPKDQDLEPSRRPSDGYEGSTGNISGEDSKIDESENEIEHERKEPAERNSFAEGSRYSRSQLEN